MNYRIGSSPRRPKRDPIETNGYRWPATRITAEDMRRLHLLSLETKKPITQLIHEAVELMYELFQEASSIHLQARCSSPKKRASSGSISWQ